MFRCSKLIFVAILLLLGSCTEDNQQKITGQPPGPYKMTLTAPHRIEVGQEVILTTEITHSDTGMPVENLRTLHERRVHNFITNLDFTNFSHIHHEDFNALKAEQIESAKLSFPYTFPTPGKYRMVSEFTDSKRSWIKHFNLEIGHDALINNHHLKQTNTNTVQNYTGTLSFASQTPIAGAPIEMEVYISRDNVPVSDLKLWLGSEAHVAIWRDDGKYFGHTHAYTPAMRQMMGGLAHQKKSHATNPKMIQEMMLRMMSQPSELIFEGPTIPVFYIFPQPGKYVMHFECAPNGNPIVFQFIINVLPSAKILPTHEHAANEIQ